MPPASPSPTPDVELAQAFERKLIQERLRVMRRLHALRLGVVVVWVAVPTLAEWPVSHPLLAVYAVLAVGLAALSGRFRGVCEHEGYAVAWWTRPWCSSSSTSPCSAAARP
jgi:uncharacterized membrane protein YdbT with pleckstrin-like domain